MTYFVFNQHQGFNRATACRCATLAEAGREILAYDQRGSGVDLVDGEYVPWKQPHRGEKMFLRPFAAASEKESLEMIARSAVFDLEAIDEARAAEIEAEIAADNA